MAPLRTCIGCRAARTPDDMVRIVRSAAGTLAVGRDLPGRGAWLCRSSPTCLDQATKRRAFGRALRGPVDESEVGRLSDVLASRSPIGSGPPSEGPVL